MAVKRVVANVDCPHPADAKTFYGDVIGMALAMDQGWIVTFAGEAGSKAQISFATEGGSGTQTPDLSIEVDDLDEVVDRQKRILVTLSPLAYASS
jgi:catechol 2,3-dioxygenase-like lactoylglutathione lyase family enzyme